MTGGQNLTPFDVHNLLQLTDSETSEPYTPARIAEMFEVTEQHVADLAKQYMPTPVDVARTDAWPPWDVPEGEQNALYLLLRTHLEYIATRGRNMDRAALHQLAELYQRLDDGWIVGYVPGVGVDYHARSAADGEMIVRLGNKASDHARILWRFPPRRPEA